jgi:hypothetical protein
MIFRWIITLPAVVLCAVIIFVIARILLGFAFFLLGSMGQFVAELGASFVAGFWLVAGAVLLNPKFRRQTAILFACISPFLCWYGLYLISELRLDRFFYYPMTLICMVAGSLLSANYKAE